MKFRSFTQHRRIKAEEHEHLEDLKTDLKIIEQALDALEEANKRFAAEFEAWRNDWRTMLGALDITQAMAAIFDKGNDPNVTAVESGADTPTANVTEATIVKHDDLEDYKQYFGAKESSETGDAEAPFNFLLF